MVFSTDSDLSFVYLQYKSEKLHGLFGLGWKNQGHAVIFNVVYNDPQKGYKCTYPLGYEVPVTLTKIKKGNSPKCINMKDIDMEYVGEK